ncbi:hypothetical protein niasHT_029809 [Heterodera trifolii]|uniref:Uncharacterized protein n=1 Tax=Heterodera trifolii TaxID=157864 RepID=A0ABD2K2Z2_9BILA
MNIFTFIFIAMLCILHLSKLQSNGATNNHKHEDVHSNGVGTQGHEIAPSNGVGTQRQKFVNSNGGQINEHEKDADYYDHEVGADDIKMNEMKTHQENSINKEQEQIVHPKLDDGVCKIHEDVKLDFHHENSTNKEHEQIVHPKLQDGVSKVHEEMKFNFNDDIFGPHISEEEERPQMA